MSCSSTETTNATSEAVKRQGAATLRQQGALLAGLLLLALGPQMVLGLFTRQSSQACSVPASLQALELAGPGWTLTNSDGSKSVEATVPVHALQAMYLAGKVDDPLKRYNELDYRWAMEDTWTFQRTFDLPVASKLHSHVDLLLTGVDTVSEVFLNEQKLGDTDNAFREWRYDVRELLKDGSNELRIQFQPAVEEAMKRAEAYPYVVPAMQGPGMQAHMNFLRKPACDFGWDWGPAFAPAGMFGQVSLISYTTPHLTGANIRQEHHADGGISLHVDVIIQSTTGREAATVSVSFPEANTDWNTQQEVSLGTAGKNVVSIPVKLEPPFNLWWPAGYGKQPLYDVSITYQPNTPATSAQPSQPIPGTSTTLQRRIGLRQITLVRDQLADDAETFYFEVNGTPIFIKGANIIPLNIFHSAVTPAAMRQMVADALEANMNMLRVWGGGHYPEDAFLDACDEGGMLVWQEAMFGCALYPRNQTFLDSVAAELTLQAQRINWHACLAIWGGNNEVETSFGWFEPSRNNSSLYAVDYSVLFVETVRAALMAIDPAVTYVDSSPSSGIICTDPYVKRWGDAGDLSKGDVHFYDYNADAFDAALYPRAKFVSEFGFQSYPSFSEYATVTAPQDWSFSSRMSEFRQRHPQGNAELLQQVQRHFPLGSALQDSQEGFQRWIYLTQCHQAHAYETAVSYWRRIKHTPARTMGALYWQLNDIWQGPSWSGINHNGTWKLLHYAAKRFYAPLLVSGYYDAAAGTVELHVTSDIPHPISGTLTVQTVSWRAVSEEASSVWSPAAKPFALEPLGSTLLASFPVTAMLPSGSNPSAAADCVITVKAEATADAAAAGDEEPQSFTSSTAIYLSEIKDAALSDPKIQAEDFQQLSQQVVQFRLRSAAVAPFVVLEVPIPGAFSDNGLLLLPWAPATLRFRGRGPVSAAHLAAKLSLLSMYAPPAAS